MTPYKYTKRGDETIFHYKYSELKEFIAHGKKEGNNGSILVKRNKNWTFLKGFGVIENPSTRMKMFQIRRLPEVFEELTDDQQILPPKSPFTETKMMFLKPIT